MKTLFAWSGGKDSAAALWRLLEEGKLQKGTLEAGRAVEDGVEVTGLLTTFTEGFGRVSMHGVREELMLAQAEALGLPMIPVVIPQHCENGEYEAAMGAVMNEQRALGVEAVAFGDLFLEDIRAYREKMLAPTGFKPLFPLWGENTASLAAEIHGAGFRARLCVVDPRVLGMEFLGRDYGPELIRDFPKGVDPCGENGEFHTFVYEAPIFKENISVTLGEKVEREGFFFIDLMGKTFPQI